MELERSWPPAMSFWSALPIAPATGRSVSGVIWRVSALRGLSFQSTPIALKSGGAPCYRTVEDLPEAPDHLALFVPADTTLEIIESAAGQGARSATIYAAGFGEGGDQDGKARAARLKHLVSKTGVAAAGPNCIGLASGAAHFVTMADERLNELRPGPVAIATQSGMLASTLTRALAERGLDVGHLVSAGNQTCLTFADYIDYFADDQNVKAILCYVETVLDPERFLASASKARANGKALVTVKIGGAEAARSAALAHTGNVAGRLDIFDAYAREAGIIRTNSLEEMVEAAEYLAHAPRPKGPNIAFMTNSGAAKSLITDTADNCSLQLATLSPETQSRIRAALGEAAEATNPLDTKLTISTDKYMGCIAALAEAPEVDLVVTIEDLPNEAGIERKVSNLTALHDYCADAEPAKSPVAVLSPVHFTTSSYMYDLRATLSAVPFLRGLFGGMRMLQTISASMAERPSLPPSKIRIDIDALLSQCVPTGDAPVALSEATSKEIISAFDIATPLEEIATTPDAACAAASEIGFPVVIKAMARDIAHKSDHGLVELGLSDEKAVRHAAETLAARVRGLGATLDGYLVAQSMTDGIEAFVGIHRDPEMGLAVMVGSGGTLLELIDDVAILTPTVDDARAREAIARTKLYKLLTGYRGGRRRDVEALVDAVVAMGRLATQIGDRLESVDVNPLLVRDEGKGVVALDALVVLRASD